MGELQCRQKTLPSYNKQVFTSAIKHVKKLAWQSPLDFPLHLQALCHDCGVALEYTRQLPKAPISGASRWFRQTPLIQLSDRFKTDDHFWFIFFHEAAHIILHGKKEIFLEDLEGTPTDTQKEDEADKYASEILLSEKDVREILSAKPLSLGTIQFFAAKFQIPAGIIAGRLQHMKVIPFTWGNELKKRINLFAEN